MDFSISVRKCPKATHVKCTQHFPGMKAMNKTSINMMIRMQECFVSSLVKEVQYGSMRKQGSGWTRDCLIYLITLSMLLWNA